VLFEIMVYYTQILRIVLVYNVLVVICDVV
jgi:hypothetical protein